MATAELIEPTTRRWTRQEFYQMMDLGWFLGQSVELIGGAVIVMPNQKSGHYATIDKSSRCLEKAFGPGFWVRTQAPLSLGVNSDPNPDISVVVGTRDDYLQDHPTTALLAVEASDSTLRYDRSSKGSIYATAKIADYWILNLADRKLEIYRRPQPDAKSEFGYPYQDVTSLSLSDTISPLAVQTTILVSDLFP